MKALIKTSFLLLFILTLTSFTNTSSTYVGKWKGEDKGEIGFFTLTNDGYAIFDFNGRTMGGKSYKQSGIDASMKYVINNDVAPNTIDFIITNNTTRKKMGSLKGIVKMLGKDRLRMAMGFGNNPRPKNFEKDAIIFSRVK